MTTKNIKTTVTSAQKKALKNKNVSDSIRYLNSQGMSRSQIASALGKRYQHVRNVLVADQIKSDQK